MIRGDHGETEMMAGGVQRYELAEATTSPRQFQFELYKRRTTVLVPRDLFLRLVCQALALYKYLAPNQRADLLLACRSVTSRHMLLSSSPLLLKKERKRKLSSIWNGHLVVLFGNCLCQYGCLHRCQV